MTKLDRASDVEFEARVKRRKRLGADLGLIAAGTTAAGIGIKGSGMAAKKLVPAVATAGKAEKVINRASGASVTTAGLAGASAGVNNSLITQAELKRRDGKRKDIYRVKRQLQAVSKSAAKNLEQNRQKRSQAYPKIAAAGAAATGAAAVGTLGSQAGVDKLRMVTRNQNIKRNQGKRLKEAGRTMYNESLAASRNIKSVNDGPSKKNADKMLRGIKNEARGLKQERRGKLGAKAAIKGQKILKPFVKPKAGIALGAASAGLAATSAVAHRNNKKGVTRPRHDWWQG